MISQLLYSFAWSLAFTGKYWERKGLVGETNQKSPLYREGNLY